MPSHNQFQSLCEYAKPQPISISTSHVIAKDMSEANIPTKLAHIIFDGHVVECMHIYTPHMKPLAPIM